MGKVILIVDDKVAYDSSNPDTAINRDKPNPPEDHKGPFHIAIPDSDVVPLDHGHIETLLIWAIRNGFFYDRGAIQDLPMELRDFFEAGPPLGAKDGE